jgi:uncharacterized damage-inducible protein DinB
MTRDEWLDLFAYDRWAGQRLLAAAARAEEAFRTDSGHGVGSARDLLVHIGDGQRVWLSRLAGTGFTREALDRYSALDAIDAHLAATNGALCGWIAARSDADLAGDFTFSNAQGAEETLPVRAILTQLYTHGVGHRGEASELLTAAGAAPDAIDYLVYTRERLAAGRTP